MTALTKRQRQVLDWVEEFIREKRYSPADSKTSAVLAGD
jgi:hypothetical protein